MEVIIDKPMTYGYNPKINEIIHLEKDDKYGILIRNINGSYMTAYITFPGVEKISSYDDAGDTYPEPHGGYTFLGTLDEYPEVAGITWLGWDYAHCFDFVCYPSHIKPLSMEKKWTSNEVLYEARDIVYDIMLGRRKS